MKLRISILFIILFKIGYAQESDFLNRTQVLMDDKGVHHYNVDGYTITS